MSNDDDERGTVLKLVPKVAVEPDEVKLDRALVKLAERFSKGVATGEVKGAVLVTLGDDGWKVGISAMDAANAVLALEIAKHEIVASLDTEDDDVDGEEN